MDILETLREIERQYDLASVVGSLEKAAEIIDNEHTEKINRECESLLRESFQLLLQEYESAEQLAWVLYRYFAALSVKGRDSRDKQNQEGKLGRPTKWGEGSEGKLILYVSVNRELIKMKNEGVAKPKIIDAIKRILGVKGTRRGERDEIKRMQSAYSEAKKLVEAALV